jgi:hypothetical protein
MTILSPKLNTICAVHGCTTGTEYKRVTASGDLVGYCRQHAIKAAALFDKPFTK